MAKQTIPSTTRKKLLTNAVKLFLKKGYERTSTRDLAKAVGIQAPGIYYYFKNKKEILHELNEDSWRRFREMVLDKAREASDPEEGIKLYIRNMIRFQFELGEKTLLVDDSVTIKNVGNRKSYEREVFDFLRESLRGLAKKKGIKNPFNVTLSAFTLFAMAARVYQWYKPKGLVSLEDLIEQITKLFLEGFLGADSYLEGGVMTADQQAVLVDPDAVGMTADGGAHRYYLLGGKCELCGKLFFPMREVCPECFDKSKIEKVQLDSHGSIVSYTVIRKAPDRKVPFAIGYVRTFDGLIVFAPLRCRMDELHVGMLVRCVFSEKEGPNGERWIAYEFVPVEETAGDGEEK